MKNKKKFVVVLCVVILFIASITFLRLRQHKTVATPGERVKTAWVNLIRQQKYNFSTSVRQITYPAPTINNAGRSSKEETYFISGETDLSQETLFVNIWQSGGDFVRGEGAISVKIEDQQAYGKFAETDWIKLDQFESNSFAPGQDAASYLSAARNVRLVDQEVLQVPGMDGDLQDFVVSHYSFDIDSYKYADLMREQLVKELQRKGKLPIGMNLDLSEQYRGMSANGEVWVNNEEIPVRLSITMEMPPMENGERIKAMIITDFHATGAKENLMVGLPSWLMGIFGLTSITQLISGLQIFGTFVGLIFLVVLLFRLAPQKVQWGVVAGLVILSMLISPMWNSVKAAEFSEEMETRQAANQAHQDNQSAKTIAAETTWDIHKGVSGTDLSAVLFGVSQATQSFEQFFSFGLKPLMDSVGDPEADQDGDGLTDAYEDDFDDSVLDKTKEDTDGDGLLDGVELKLDLLPGEADSDNDKIEDAVEIVSFFYHDLDWYMNPAANDTDSDGILDGVECPERSINASDPMQGVCRDTDGDGTPDVFDTDDDNDGVPTNVDNSPYYSGEDVHSLSNPYQFQVENVNENFYVILDLQIRPENVKHLTYMMNVLDWPSGDNDGQIMRVNDSTFSDQFTSDQNSQDPKAAQGDMRLIPMLEFHIDGSSIPFPLSNHFDIAFHNEQIDAVFTATASDLDEVRIEKKEGPSESLTLYSASGNCDEFSNRRTVGTFDPGGNFVFGISLGSIAEGDHVFLIENASGNELGCAQPFAAHGNLQDKVVDVDKLAQYGASARNDNNGDILVYAPLTLEYDQSESSPVAFRTRIPYYNGDGRMNAADQEVSMVWMLNMLTDVCKEIPSDYDPSEDGDWCDVNNPDRWISDISRVVHTYPDSFQVTGINVIEDHGVDLDVILEDPQTDTDIDYDDQLWGMAYGLQGTFLSGDEVITLDEVYNRFDRNVNGAFAEDDEKLWGLQKDAFQVEQYHYDSEDSQSSFVMEEVYDLLDLHFGSYTSEIGAATLLFARDKHQRTLTGGDSDVVCSAGGCVFNFANADLITQAILNWAPYQWNGEDWETFPLTDYLDLLEANLRQTAEYDVENASDEDRDVIDGKINMARFTYETYYRGMVMLTRINGTPVINFPAIINDQHIFNQFYRNNTKGQIVTKVVTTFTEILILGIEKNPNYYLVVGKVDKTRNFFKAIKDGISQKLSKISNILNTTTKRVAFGIAAAVIIIGLAVCAILYLANPDSLGGRIGGRVLFAAIGLVSMGLGITALTDAVAVVQAGKAVANSVKGAAIVGAVIGVVITWGVFFYTWSSSGATAFSLEFNSMLADAIAATMTIILMAALMMTGIGAIIVAVIAIIDGLIMTICAAAGAYEEDEDHWSRQYVCIGISGWVTKIFKWFIYSQTFIVKYDDENRLEFVGVDTEVQDEVDGMISGNHMKLTVSIKSTITKSSVPLDWKALAYFWQYSAGNAKSTTLEYRVQTSENNFDGDLDRGDMKNDWIPAGKDKWSIEVDASTSGYPIELPAAGINRDLTAYVSEGAAIPVQECWVIPPNSLTLFMWIPVCYVRTYSNTIHIDMSDSITVDVFPATLDEFYTLTQVDEYGYALAWGRDASLKFPKLRDADGDSLVSKAFSGGNDPDDSLYDTDNDGLSDYYEITNGTDPRLFDTDEDGLYDLKEIQLGSDPLRKDSDGDGLIDSLELEGWLFVYDFEVDGTPLETMVYSNPLVADSDFDGITDLLEKIYGFNPNAPSDPSILEYELKMQEYDSPAVMLRFEDGNGATMFTDSSNFRFDGFCEDGSCPAAGISGRYGEAVRFDGEQAVTLTTTSAAFSYENNTPFTVSGWIKWTTTGTILAKWSDDPNAKNGFRLEIDPSGYLVLTGTSGSVSAASAIQPETWIHYAVTFDGSEVGFYMNGNQAGCSGGSCSWENSTTYIDTMTDVPIMVGAYAGTSGLANPFSGALDEVAVFDRALSQQEIQERQFTARYNFNDSFVRPGEEIAYQSLVKNLLNNRFAYGLLYTNVDQPQAVVDHVNKFAPKTFVLYPDNPVVTGVSEEFFEETIQIEPGLTETMDLTIEQNVSAQIVDRRTESNFAELWLKFNESVGASEFEDSSGNMPPRTAACLGSCPVSGQSGILNQSVKIQANSNQALALPDLDRLDMVNRGYTVSVWVKPSTSSSTALPIITSVGNQFGLSLVPSGSSYTPVVYQNGSQLSYTPWRRITSGVWNHLVVVYSSASQVLEVYINGARVSSLSGIAPISTNADLVFGGMSQVELWVDDLRTFGRPLSYLDISRLAEKPVLNLTMDSNFSDQSEYDQTISIPKNSPTLSSTAIRGNSLYPGSGSTQGYIQVNGDNMLNLSDGAFTISTWVYPQHTGSGTWQGIFGKREMGDEANAYVTLERLGEKLRFGFGDGTAYRSKTSGDILPLNQWTNILISFQPNEVNQYEYKLFLNSELKDSYLFPSGQKPTSATTFYVGHSSHVYRLYIGNLDMDDEHDAGSNAEVYLEAYIGGAYQYDIPSSGEHDMEDGDVWYINRSMTEYSYRTLEYEVWEEDSTSGDDYCGHVEKYWYSDNETGTAGLSNGFDGDLHYSFTRNSIQFVGRIDEMQIYRYAVNNEQVTDIYQSIPITANMPLNDRPSADTFENKAVIGEIDDGECVGAGCPAAGTIGLLNQAVRFDGEDDQIEVPVNTTNSYMVSLWINSDCEDCGVFTEKSGVNTIFELYTSGGNICGLSGTSEICSQGANLLDEQWHHIVYSNQEGSIKLWLDGKVVNQMNGNAVPAANSGTAILGMAASAESDYLSGQMDDVRIFRYVQPDAVVLQLYQRAPFLLAHLDDEDASDGIPDDTDRDWLLGCVYDSDPEVSTCPKTGVAGRLINGLEFDAQNDILSLTQPVLSDDLTEFSVSIWVKPVESFNHPQTLWTIWDKNNTALKYGLALVADGLSLCVLSASDSTTCDMDTNVELIANNWNHVTFVVQRASATLENYQLYINGYLDSEGIGNQDSAISDGLGKLELGNQALGSNPFGAFGGGMDEVSIYSYALNEINIRDSFHYQMEHVEETDTLTMTIDADDPQGMLVSYNDSFPYMPNLDKLLHYETLDSTSGMAMVEVTTQFGSLGTPRLTTAPLCLDSSSGTSFCPTFDPIEGEGKYSLQFRSIDKVGNQTQDGPYTYYVDGTGPRIVVNLVEGQIVGARKHQTMKNTWVLHLSGSVNDELLADGSTGSGLETEYLRVAIYSEANEITGNGSIKPELTQTSTGYDWEVDYLFPENEPTGKLILLVSAVDKVGNETVRTIHIYLDSTAPIGSLDEGVVPNPESEEDLDYRKSASKEEERAKILTQTTLSGTASDIPGMGLPYMTNNGENAATSVTAVETGFVPALQTSFQYNEPYPDGLLVWLPLDKEEVPSGEDGNPDPEQPERYYLDISPYQISGDCYGEECPSPGLVGHKNGSMIFNGQQQRINLGTNVDLANRSFTISLWAKRDETNRPDPFLWQGPLSLPDQRFLFGFNASNQMVCGFGGTDLVTSGLSEDTEWHYWACSYDLQSGTRSLWKDGQILTSDTTNPIPQMTENLYLGLAPVGSFMGSLDELIILEQALSAEQIRDQYTAYQPIFALEAENEFILSGETLPDYSGYFHQVLLTSQTEDIVNKSVTGKVGNYAFGLDGNDSLVVSPAFSLNLDRAQFSQTAWVYPLNTDQEIGLFSQTSENPERRYPSVMIMPDRSIKVGFGTGYTWEEVKTQAGIVPINEWSFIASVFDGTTISIYLNDMLVLTSQEFAGSLPYPSQQFEVGKNLYGVVDQPLIFPRALEPFEILALYHTGWKSAELTSSGNEVTWQTQVPFGLEGPYNLDVRAGDGESHILSDQTKARLWGGVVDSFPPRMILVREPAEGDDPNRLFISFEITDTMLDPDTIHQNLCEGIELEKTYFNSSWYLAGGVAPNSALYRIRGTCYADARTTEETGIIACDAAGNCSGETFLAMLDEKVYLPLIVGGSGQGTTIASGASSGLEALLQRASSWPKLSETIKVENDLPLVEAWVSDSEITYQDVRSVMHLNLHGEIRHADALSDFKVRIIRDGQLLVETRAAVYGEVWNALWPFVLGDPPQDGEYRLELILTDKSGQVSILTDTIWVDLTPQGKE